MIWELLWLYVLEKLVFMCLHVNDFLIIALSTLQAFLVK